MGIERSRRRGFEGELGKVERADKRTERVEGGGI